MNTDTIPQTVLFSDLFNKPLVATFDQPHASSDGGAILLKAAEARYGLIDGFARCLVENRQSGKVRHTLEDLLAQRIYGLACGHPDANDADRLADDPIHKLLLGRDPVDGDALASQPTIPINPTHDLCPLRSARVICDPANLMRSGGSRAICRTGARPTPSPGITGIAGL